MNQNSPTTKSISTYGAISIVALIVLFAYLVCIRLGIYLPFPIFWGCLIVILLMFMVQVFSSENGRNSNIRWVFPVLLALVWLLKTVVVPVDVPFFGSDSYVETAATNEIRNVGWFALSPWQHGLSHWINSTNYPFLSALSISLIDPIHFSQYPWSRWGLVILSLLSLGFVYAINFEIFKSRKVALLGSIGYGLSYMFLMFHSFYIRETLAFVFFFAVIYCVVKTSQIAVPRYSYFYQVTSLVCATGLIFTHHLTGIMLLVFLLHLNIVRVISRTRLVQSRFRISVKGNLSWTLWSFVLVALLTFWVYLKKSPLNIIESMIEDALSGQTAATFLLPQTARYNLLLYIQIFTTVAFGMIAVFGILQEKAGPVFVFNSVSWGALTGLGSMFFALAGIPGTSSISSRFELYGYAFLIPAAAYGAFGLAKRRKWLAIPLSMIFMVYGLNSVYRLPLYLFSQFQPDYLRGELRSMPFSDEYNMLSKLKPGTTIGAVALLRWIDPLSGAKARIWSWDMPPGQNPSGFDVVIVGQVEQLLMANNYYSNTPESLGMSRVYAAGQAALYVPSLPAGRPFDISTVMNDHANASETTATPILSWGYLVLEILLICFLANLILRIYTHYKFYEFPLGAAIVFNLIFLVYILTDAIGYKSPGPWVIISLLVLSGVAVVVCMRNRKGLPSAMTIATICLLCGATFGYAFMVDVLFPPYTGRPYSEFYIKLIEPCQDTDCITLHITNLEGHEQGYIISGIPDAIVLQAGGSWEGILQQELRPDAATRIDLLGSDQTPLAYLILQPHP